MQENNILSTIQFCSSVYTLGSVHFSYVITRIHLEQHEGLIPVWHLSNLLFLIHPDSLYLTPFIVSKFKPGHFFVVNPRMFVSLSAVSCSIVLRYFALTTKSSLTALLLLVIHSFTHPKKYL